MRYFTISLVIVALLGVTYSRIVSRTNKELSATGDVLKKSEFLKDSTSSERLVRKLKDQTIVYTLGSRVQDDFLLQKNSDTFLYPAKKDVTLLLEYPDSGTNIVPNIFITYVEIICVQDRDDGNAYLKEGGIGQNFISLQLEAKQTEHFSYTIQYYGIKV